MIRDVVLPEVEEVKGIPETVRSWEEEEEARRINDKVQDRRAISNT
jgi:hypothetical protein